MATARSVITSALKLIGVIQKSEAPSADEAADALASLNDLLGTWSNESLLINAKSLENFPITANIGSYTIGTGQTFNTPKPIVITQAFIRDGDIDRSLRIISDEEYNELDYKTTASLTDRLMYDNNGTIRLYPVPNTSGTLFLFMEKPLANIASLDSDIDFPTGWNRALRYNLAIELAPEYDVVPSPLIMMQAGEAKGAIKTTVLRSQPETQRRYRGWYNGYLDIVE